MNNLFLKQGLNAHQLALVQSEFDKKKKSKGIAFALWWFGAGLALHRFYLGDTGRAVAMLLLGWATLFIWNLLDGFAISKRVEQINDQRELEIITRVKAGAGV